MNAPDEEVTLGTEQLEAYVPAVRRYFSRRVSAGEVDDFVQEVFVRLQAQTGGESIQHLDLYLFTIAASVLTDHARRRSVRRGAAHESLAEEHHPTEELTPERVLLDREALDVVVAAIDTLPPRTRDVFVLHRFEEMSCSSIATELGISISAVEKHIMKALRILHGRLAKD